MESLIGTMGLDKLLSPKSMKIRKSDILKGANFNMNIPKSIKAFLNAEKPEPFKVPKNQIMIDDFDTIIEELNQEFSFSDLEKKFDTISAENSSEFLADYVNVLNTLQQAKPQVERIGILGTEEVDPSSQEKAEFIWLCRLANDINWLFDLMNMQSLSQAESNLFRQLFPDTYQIIVLELLTQLMDSSTDKVNSTAKTWKLPVITSLLQVPSIEPDELLSLQQQFAETPSETQPGQQKPELEVSQGMTQSQKLEE